MHVRREVQHATMKQETCDVEKMRCPMGIGEGRGYIGWASGGKKQTYVTKELGERLMYHTICGSSRITKCRMVVQGE